MKIEDAKEKLCPFKPNKCDTTECMAWVFTCNGKKEVDRYKIPYDTYPIDAGNLHRRYRDNGYVEVERELYIKYEESFEGYCSFVDNGINKDKK